jgi:hypothetical protein
MAVHIHGNTESSSSYYTPIQLEEYDWVCPHGIHNTRIPNSTYSIVERINYYDSYITEETVEVDDISTRIANVNEPPVLKLLPCGVVLTVTSSIGGAIYTPIPHTIIVEGGILTTITALAEEGYLFTGWNIIYGDAIITDSSNASTTIMLTAGDATVNANFEYQNK